MLFDKWTYSCGFAVLDVLVRSFKVNVCLDASFLEGNGPNNVVEHKGT